MADGLMDVVVIVLKMKKAYRIPNNTESKPVTKSTPLLRRYHCSSGQPYYRASDHPSDKNVVSDYFCGDYRF